ncbi:MAG: enoyl-CoA hydratase/isomerase family protein [bacterium]|nr:enoyl-CoA hydratase/isomerase family protein [bacterium]
MLEIPTPPGLVVSEVSGGVVTVTIDRPDKANSVSRAMHTRLCTLWSEISAEPDVRAIVVTGTGTVFCSGGDRSEWGDLLDDRTWRDRKMYEARTIITEVLSCPVPIVAAVNGAAIGFGCSLAVACDVLVMAEDAYLRDPHVAAGLVAGDGGAALLPEVLPLAVARRMLFGGDRLSAREAHQHSLAHDVVALDRLHDRALELAHELAAQPREALQGTKYAINLGLLTKIRGVLAVSAESETRSFDSAEFRATTRPAD